MTTQPNSDHSSIVAAGHRLATMLRASFTQTGYGSPEHEERCREALREWSAVAHDDKEQDRG